MILTLILTLSASAGTLAAPDSTPIAMPPANKTAPLAVPRIDTGMVNVMVGSGMDAHVAGYVWVEQLGPTERVQHWIVQDMQILTDPDVSYRLELLDASVSSRGDAIAFLDNVVSQAKFHGWRSYDYLSVSTSIDTPEIGVAFAAAGLGTATHYAFDLEQDGHAVGAMLRSVYADDGGQVVAHKERWVLDDMGAQGLFRALCAPGDNLRVVATDEEYASVAEFVIANDGGNALQTYNTYQEAGAGSAF